MCAISYISLFLYITSSCLLKYDIILENIMLEDFIQVSEVGKTSVCKDSYNSLFSYEWIFRHISYSSVIQNYFQVIWMLCI